MPPPLADLYSILKISRHATLSEIKKAYHQLCFQFHPDVTRQGNKPSKGDEMFKKLNEAYRILSDPHERAAYDRLHPNQANTNQVNTGYRNTATSRTSRKQDQNFEYINRNHYNFDVWHKSHYGSPEGTDATMKAQTAASSWGRGSYTNYTNKKPPNTVKADPFKEFSTEEKQEIFGFKKKDSTQKEDCCVS